MQKAAEVDSNSTIEAVVRMNERDCQTVFCVGWELVLSVFKEKGVASGVKASESCIRSVYNAIRKVIGVKHQRKKRRTNNDTSSDESD